MGDRTLNVGDEVFYTGDAANLPGFGAIVAKRPDGSVDVTLHAQPSSFGDEYSVPERSFRGVYPSMFDEAPGRRFWLRTEWAADQRTKEDRFAAMCRESAAAAS